MAATRVLVVDDNNGIRLGVRLYLEACGFEVLDAVDCASALAVIREHEFDACILDYSLPDGTALPVLEQIAIAQPGMKTIVLTAYPSATVADAIRRSGAARFITKPIALDTLRRMIDELTMAGGAPAAP